MAQTGWRQALSAEGTQDAAKDGTHRWPGTAAQCAIGCPETGKGPRVWVRVTGGEWEVDQGGPILGCRGLAAWHVLGQARAPRRVPA